MLVESVSIEFSLLVQRIRLNAEQIEKAVDILSHSSAILKPSLELLNSY